MSSQVAFAIPVTHPQPGQLDLSFAAAGTTQVYFADSLSSMTNDVAVDACGRILVAAKVGTADGSRFGLARLLADGSADLSFGAQGSVIGQFERGFEAMGGKVVLLPDGSILLAGLHYLNGHRTLPALALFDHQGQPVLSFGDKGRCVVRLPGNLAIGVRDAWLPPGVPGAEACDVRLQADGRILLLANHHFELADHVGLLICLRPDGALDDSFNGRGFVIVRHLLMNTWLSSLLVQRDGRILVGGSINFPEEGLLARYQADGQLDDSFAVDGFMSFSSGGRSTQVSHVVQQANADLLCVGSSRDPMHCLSLQLHSNGRPDAHCHGGQPRLLAIGHSGCQWTAALALADGRSMTVGATIGGCEADFILARHLPDGQLDRQFGDGLGWVRTRLGRSLDTATSLAVQGDGAIVVGGYSLDGSYRAVVARYLG
ncbi:delta-60 repeat domain-containing protein [Pseudomonas sp. LB3P31]